MKTIETKLFSYNELTDKAKETVIADRATDIQSEPENFTLEECMDSLNAVAKALGMKLTDWSIGPYNQGNFASVDCYDSGDKALARMVRCLMDNGYPRPKTFKEMEFDGTCGFTGVCFDDDVCQAIWEALLDGEHFSKAFDRAADRIMRICEVDLEYRCSEDGILEMLDTKEEIYTEQGSVF